MYQESAGDPLVGLFGLLIVAAIYLYCTFSLYKIAQKLNTPNAFFAFIPILNLWLMCEMAEKSPAWIIGLIIPVVQIVAMIFLWVPIAKRLGKTWGYGVLMAFPPTALFIVGVLAFSGGNAAPRRESLFPPHHSDQPKQPQNVG